MTRSLIVGVDDSDDSRNALARAAELARAAGLLKAPSRTVSSQPVSSAN